MLFQVKPCAQVSLICSLSDYSIVDNSLYEKKTDPKAHFMMVFKFAVLI